jgi:hypothetical protein
VTSFKLNPLLSVIHLGPKPSTLSEAFDISIAKWEFILAKLQETGQRIYDGGTNSCGLCQMFYHWGDDTHDASCGKCPVAEHTGMDGCQYTPYEDFYPKNKTIEQRIDAAKAEIAFLKMLREKHCGAQSSC